MCCQSSICSRANMLSGCSEMQLREVHLRIAIAYLPHMLSHCSNHYFNIYSQRWETRQSCSRALMRGSSAIPWTARHVSL